VIQAKNFSTQWKIFVILNKLAFPQIPVIDTDDMPLVSICIPTYNAALTIRESLESILNQTYANILVHVSDNASSDDTLKIIESIQDPRLIIHRHEINIGGEGNFNRCIQYAEGKYTAIFHADDVYELEIIKTQVTFLEENDEAGVVFTEAKTIDSNGRITGLIGQSFNGSGNIDLYDFHALFKTILRRGNFIVCPSAMFRTDLLKNQIERWRGELFKSSADLDVWLRIASSHCVAFLKQPLMRYRIDNKQYSNKVRLRTTQADFFLVIDHYLQNLKFSEELTKKDKLNYLMLLKNDMLWRSINFFCMGDMHRSMLLCRRVLSFNLIIASLSSLRNLMMLCASILMYVFNLFKLKKIGKFFITHLRNINNK
jgi:glycosyltransferase involved in cell wall biosynthesis